MSLSDAAMKRQSPDITTQGNEDKRDDQLHNPHSTVPMNANNDTPMLQSPKSASKSPFEEEDRLSESEETPVQLCATDEDRKMPARPTPGPDGLDIGSMQSTSTANREQNQQYSFLTSAYVQNLAEICHTILEDRHGEWE
ncbi:expressed unknown protein [Seminavis robusta]|uniref:Uncharacterized protein n=1 Tax=Seminavis robusta TaxID=568900 RepID=A0A9N8EW13_9STRA|nr:expressed unknown protein [Seminavis robusta]|eukprot:Sro2191_g318390.1 n/a (140) ;mRNA; r:16794-17213